MTVYVMHPGRAAMTPMARQQAQYHRDAMLCRCGHLGISHVSSDIVGVFQGIGGGLCSREVNGRCWCGFFVHDAPDCHGPDDPCEACALFVPVMARPGAYLMEGMPRAEVSDPLARRKR